MCCARPSPHYFLVDSDWAINVANWYWLSASAFFNQYFRIYSPITFGKKYDPQGKFVRHYLPVLKDMPPRDARVSKTGCN